MGGWALAQSPILGTTITVESLQEVMNPVLLLRKSIS